MIKINRNNVAIRPWAPDRNPEFRGYTGHLFETEVLGECRFRIVDGSFRRIPLWEAKNIVYNNQPWKNPSRPTGEAGNFYAAVASKMRSFGFNTRRLQMFTAVGSPLDRQYGIDGFFRFEGIIVTVDCTLDSNRDVRQSAKVMVTGDDMVAGYENPAHDIAYWFEKARRERKLGVV